jgi:F-type H+-transporting ATPase subunit epsilon
MILKIISPSAVIYQGEVLKVQVPTAAWEIGILPHHIPLTSIVVPGLVRFLPKEKNSTTFMDDTEFLFEDDMVTLSVGKWLIYLDGESVELLVNGATTRVDSDASVLEKLKQDLEKEIEEIKLKWDITALEKAYISLQKVTADLKLQKIKHRKQGRIESAE